MEQVSDYAIFALDAGGFVQTWNVGAERLKGYAASEIVGHHFSIFYTAEDQAAGLPEELLGVAEADGTARHTGWRVRQDGSRFWCEVTITALRADGVVNGFAKVTRDLTAQHVLEQERLAFLRSLDHDLRTPLTSLRGFVELAAERASSRDQMDWLHRAGVSLDELETMMDAILTGAITGPDRGPLQLEPLSVFHLVSLVVEQLPDRLAATRVQLPGADRRVLANTHAMQRVLTNVIINALAYSAVSTPVQVYVESHDNLARIVIADHGQGIHPGDVETVFDFGRRGRLTADIPGTGIGLASARMLVLQQGGLMWLESQVGRGTRVMIELPQA